MDQGDAAIWAAGLGIAGTLLGALGGAAVQMWSQRRQVSDQEAVDVSHWLRGQRQVAFGAVLDASDQVTEHLGPVIEARVQPDWHELGDHRELWAPCNNALGLLQKAVTSIAVTGPPEMEERAKAVHDADLRHANCLRQPGMQFDERIRAYAESIDLVREARDRFTSAARDVLASTTVSKR